MHFNFSTSGLLGSILKLALVLPAFAALVACGGDQENKPEDKSVRIYLEWEISEGGPAPYFIENERSWATSAGIQITQVKCGIVSPTGADISSVGYVELPRFGIILTVAAASEAAAKSRGYRVISEGNPYAVSWTPACPSDTK